jgi:hypothetical protein
MSYIEAVRTHFSVLLLLVVPMTALAQDAPLLVAGENDLGAVWANVSLTQMRIDEPFLPMVIAIQNRSDETVKIDRQAMWLIGPTRERFPMAELRELRDGYTKRRLDSRIATSAGIPVDVWYRQRRLMESNFFPDISGGGGTVIDRVTLRRQDAMVDLIYFHRPRGLTLDSPFILEIAPDGWEAPLRMLLKLR